jgi:AcrR family transcriptional regulator
MARPTRTTHDALVRHATALVAEHGAHGLQVRAVAQAAGVATGTLYNYFPDRAHLLLAVARQVEADIVDVLDAAAPASTPLVSAVPEVARCLIELGDGPRALPGLWTLPTQDGEAEGPTVRRWLSQRVRREQVDGRVGPVDPDLVAAMAYALVRAALTHLAADPSLRDDAEHLIAHGLHALLPRADPPASRPMQV